MQNIEIGRILRAATQGFAVGCRATQLDLPAFGALVKVTPLNGQETIYGLIYNINVDDDPLVQRLVLAESPKPAVIEDQRQNRILPIEMSVIAIGYERDGIIRQGFPPRPPLNLDPVVMVLDQDEIARFTDKLSYLRLILRAANENVPVDQLLVAHIRDVYRLRGDDAAWALRVIEEVIELLRANYETLMPTLEALNDALPELPVSAEMIE
ncbi:MAG: hypothetical protein M9918_01570 [Anaerolineae bacterium]|nr:hypothetical protein [Anaerolineae bacterium]MCO5186882.1 hypothetical protein [Anaerolineae bacterium]MCO5192633.1 hypothetical protein [Anaerolineae bacterium]